MSAGFDRRSFLSTAAAAGALAAAAAVPLTARALAFGRGDEATQPLEGPSFAQGSAEAATDADGHIDDMWGHTPRYAHPIPHSPMRTSPIDWEHVDPIDRFLVI